MNFIAIKVECYSGHKADEYPVCFYWMNIKFEIKEIVDRWYQAQATPDWPVADYFKVCTASKSIYIIKHELESDQWFVVSTDDPIIRYSSN